MTDLVGALVGLLWTSTVAVLVLLVVELACFLELMARAWRIGHPSARPSALVVAPKRDLSRAEERPSTTPPPGSLPSCPAES